MLVSNFATTVVPAARIAGFAATPATAAAWRAAAKWLRAVSAGAIVADNASASASASPIGRPKWVIAASVFAGMVVSFRCLRGTRRVLLDRIANENIARLQECQRQIPYCLVNLLGQ